jgi:ATP-dependent DNA helicase RecG
MANHMREISLETPLYDILGARTPLLKRFEKIGIKTVRDLLWHFPSRYEDFSEICKIDDLEPGELATVQAAIEEVTSRRTRRGLTIIEAMLSDESGTIRAVWFNQPYIANTLHAGRIANFSGKVSISEENELYFNNPTYEIIRQDSEAIHTGRLVPVYPETKGLTSRGIRFAIRIAMKHNPALAEWIPQEILSRYDLPDLQKALQDIHLPARFEDATAAQRRFRFENLFLLQLFNLQQKLKLSHEQAPVIPIDVERIKHILATLPFSLTQSQKQSLWDIVQDLAKPKPMNRLLQGDVGSGKTIVAAIAAITAAEHGFQTVFMAPTEILARQHFETFQRFLKHVAQENQPTVGLATGSGTIMLYDNDLTAKTPKAEFWKKSAAGEIAIVFGTHALVEKSARFKNLGLVVIDEQHRFGVNQRKTLARSASAAGIPHLLSMSATPIPRTLMMTVFGDLDVSLITELPAGRKPILTKIVSPIERQTTYEFIRGEVKKGRQAFVICPLITPDTDVALREDAGSVLPKKKSTDRPVGIYPRPDRGRTTTTLDLRSVEEEYEKLSTKIFPEFKIAMLHGKMKPKEKETVMRDFKEGKIDMLVATSVIEVGVDVPNAAIMIIEGADRFGLAQLYQFRGRIGRGEYQSYCFLMTEMKGEKAKARLRAILKAKNGFELAEEDLKLRGPGEFFGEVQSGFSDATLEALRDPALVKTSREAAAETVRTDPTFKNHLQLKIRLAAFTKNLHRE